MCCSKHGLVPVVVLGRPSTIHNTALNSNAPALLRRRVAVAPLECMPTKIASSQIFHVADREGLRSLSISFNYEPMDLEPLENFPLGQSALGRRGAHGGIRRLSG